MQLALSLSVLLASLLAVDALPYRRDAGLVTLPLKRLHGQRSDVHPQLLLQQHMNRGHKRLARMTGRDEPTAEQQLAKLHKRMFLLENGPGSHSDKRFNRDGVNNNANAVASHRMFRKKKGSKAAGLAAGAAAGVAAGAVAGAAASAAGNSSSNSTSAGVSPLDIAAAASDGLTDANTPTTNNSLGLDIEANDVGYIATIQIGTPAQDFKILMDSGSADFWVGATQCEEAQEQAAPARRSTDYIPLNLRKGGSGASQAGAAAAAAGAGTCGDHTFLGTATSSSFVDSGAPFSVTYGSGAVAGTIVNDDVSVAGLALNNHTFGTANQETVQFTGAPFDGLMGLAQSTLSEQKVLTPVESLAQNGLISDAITSFKISRLADQLNDGEVTFGGLDATKFDPATLTTFANVNTQGFWEGAMPAVAVNGQDAGLAGRTAILDTGTTLIIAPPADAAAVHALITGAASDGQGGFTVPCTLTDSVALTFGNTSFAIDPRDIAVAPVDAADPTGTCTSGISSGEIGAATEWLVGDVFLKNAYFSTDVGKNQISLAKLV
ncbi:hypothetical protein HWV62_2237 [Athelia sp. TMB]|nr:hypothetical protein HWV62_6069 [Athelia sp. TMB]KAF7985682.1 hypothetical protein HWV62_2237 [Athelia sp. TMB]